MVNINISELLKELKSEKVRFRRDASSCNIVLDVCGGSESEYGVVKDMFETCGLLGKIYPKKEERSIWGFKGVAGTCGICPKKLLEGIIRYLCWVVDGKLHDTTVFDRWLVFIEENRSIEYLDKFYSKHISRSLRDYGESVGLF